MIDWLFSPKMNLGISVLMMVAGLGLAIANWPLKLIGVGEPVLIYQMSAMALWFSGYGNILVSVVRKEADDGPG